MYKCIYIYIYVRTYIYYIYICHTCMYVCCMYVAPTHTPTLTRTLPATRALSRGDILASTYFFFVVAGFGPHTQCA